MTNKRTRGRPALVNNLTTDQAIELVHDLKVKADCTLNHIATNWGKKDRSAKKLRTAFYKIDEVLGDLTGATPLTDDDIKKIRTARLNRIAEQAIYEAGLGEQPNRMMFELEKHFFQD